MIQRIQSVYLLLAGVVSAGLIIVLPLYNVAGEGQYILDFPVYFALTLLSALVSFFSIFRYKNRKQQFVSGRINILLNFVLLGLMLYHFFDHVKDLESGNYDLGLFMPVVAIVLIALANRAIMKDEKLVRSADRLR